MTTTEELSSLAETPKEAKPEQLGKHKIASAAEAIRFINLLVYGESGVGKTVLCGSADLVPSMHPVLVLDVEGGTYSLRSKYPDCRVVRVEDWDQVQSVYDELYKMKHGYKTIVVDSLTEIQKFSMYHILEAAHKKDEDKDEDVAGMREWNKNTEQVRRFVRAFRDLPMNCLFTAHVQQIRDPGGKTLNRPSLSGKLAMEVAGFVDIVLFYYKKQVGRGEDMEIKRLLLSQGTDTTVAKDRSWSLPTVIEEPTMTQIHNFISGEAK